jgi:hypothetical protein
MSAESGFEPHVHRCFLESILLNNYRVRSDGKIEKGIEPLSVSRDSCTKLVDLLFALTFVPLMAAWLGSLTTPFRLASVRCREPTEHTEKMNDTANKMR